jgi:nucleoid-associated protein YgaU
MGRDFKIGLTSGLILAVVGLIWVATRPSLSPEARMRRSSQAAAEKDSQLQHTARTVNETAPPESGASREQPLPGMDSARAAQANADTPARQTPASDLVSPGTSAGEPSRVPDLTIYERAEKIKTTRFHIVRKDETLSAISQQYYGTPGKWRAIFEANKGAIRDANKVSPGTKLTIPE